jgi:D-glycero-alpha-D-manno-heptose-7-phosphate kinase
MNVIRFRGENDFVVERVPISRARMNELSQSLLLYFTGLTRRAHDVEAAKISNMGSIQDNLRNMLLLVDRAYDALTGNGDLSLFGRLLHDTWMEKRSLSRAVTAPAIDRLYDRGIAAGALGGKLLGAGGGGFMLFFVPPERQATVQRALKEYHEVPFAINAPGSTVIHS